MQIGWIDFSKKDRDKVFAVLDALSEPGAVDELGIGAIRDGFADLFFPGTSTVQSRAKYFLLIPYILKNAMRGAYGTDAESILSGIDQEEERCARKMIAVGGRDESILGWRTIAANRWLVRPPSLIYWNGLKTLGIVKEIKSIKSLAHLIADSLKSKGQKNMIKVRATEDDDGDDSDAYAPIALRVFSEGFDELYKSDWANNLDIKLTLDEAAFLEQRILATKPNSLLAYLIKKNNGTYNADTFAKLYAAVKDQDDLPEATKAEMLLAVQVSRFLRVGFAAYNLVLAGDNTNTNGVIKASEIIAEARPRFAEIASVDLDTIFAMLNIGDITLKVFLRTLKEKMMGDDIEGIKELVTARERWLKRERAKVNKAGSFTDWVGLDNLDFRLQRNASRVIADIREGKNV